MKMLLDFYNLWQLIKVKVFTILDWLNLLINYLRHLNITSQYFLTTNKQI